MRLKLRRLLTNPTTRVESVDGDAVRLQVDGLVCDTVCAIRTKDALEAMPGARSASVDFETGAVTIDGTPHPPEAYERAVRGAVAGKPVRRMLEIAAHAIGGSRGRAPSP